jgi:hypothetical protein
MPRLPKHKIEPPPEVYWREKWAAEVLRTQELVKQNGELQRALDSAANLATLQQAALQASLPKLTPDRPSASATRAAQRRVKRKYSKAPDHPVELEQHAVTKTHAVRPHVGSFIPSLPASAMTAAQRRIISKYLHLRQKLDITSF